MPDLNGATFVGGARTHRSPDGRPRRRDSRHGPGRLDVLSGWAAARGALL